MKFRKSLLLAPVVAGLFLGGLAPARADTATGVTDLSATAVQTKHVKDTFTVSAHWQLPADTSVDSVLITDDASGAPSEGKDYPSRDVAASAVSVSFVTDQIAEGRTYYVAVKTIGGDITVASFDTPALDQTAPSGTFRIDKTSAFLAYDFTSDEDGPTASFKVTQTAGEAGVTRKVLAGDGSEAKAWGLGSLTLTYTKAGRYTPHVLLTDAYANTRDIALPSVRVMSDTTAPALTITKPAKPARKASWRTIRGTASDSGVGMYVLVTYVGQKRDGVWWLYDFKTKKWLEGYASWNKTGSKTKAQPWGVSEPSSTAWHTPKVKGIQKGQLRVLALAADNNFNIAQKVVNQRVR